MYFDVGDTAPLSQFRVTTVAGVLTNATVAVTVTKPDGTTTSPSVTNTSTGLYDASVTVDQAGEWTYLWVATGSAAAKEPGQLTVVSPRVLVATMDEFRAHLNRTDLTDDSELRTYLASATDWVEGEIGGPVSITTFTETHLTEGDIIIPRHRPLVSVTSITPYQGTAMDATTGYRADTNVNAIFLRYHTAYEYTLVYRAGLAVIPEKVKLAGLIVAQHLWQTQNGGGGLPFPGDADVAPVIGAGFAVPNRAKEVLGHGAVAGVA